MKKSSAPVPDHIGKRAEDRRNYEPVLEDVFARQEIVNHCETIYKGTDGKVLLIH
jgi:hypothetical protein